MGKRMKWEFDLDQKSARSKFNILMKTPEELIMKIIMECIHIKHFMRYKSSLKTLKRKKYLNFLSEFSFLSMIIKLHMRDFHIKSCCMD